MVLLKENKQTGQLNNELHVMWPRDLVQYTFLKLLKLKLTFQVCPGVCINPGRGVGGVLYSA